MITDNKAAYVVLNWFISTGIPGYIRKSTIFYLLEDVCVGGWSEALPVVGAGQQDVAVHSSVVGGDAANGDEELRLSTTLLVLLVLQR